MPVSFPAPAFLPPDSRVHPETHNPPPCLHKTNIGGSYFFERRTFFSSGGDALSCSSPWASRVIRRVVTIIAAWRKPQSIPKENA